MNQIGIRSPRQFNANRVRLLEDLVKHTTGRRFRCRYPPFKVMMRQVVAVSPIMLVWSTVLKDRLAEEFHAFRSDAVKALKCSPSEINGYWMISCELFRPGFYLTRRRLAPKADGHLPADHFNECPVTPTEGGGSASGRPMNGIMLIADT